MKMSFVKISCLLLVGLFWSFSAQAQSFLDGGKSLAVDADDAIEWHREEKAYIARGNAIVSQGDFSVKADKLSALYRENATGKSEIYRITAEGHVIIKGPEQTAYGDKGVYDLDKAVAVLTGKKLRIENVDGETVTADKSLEYWQEKKLAVARGNATAIQGENKLRANDLVALFSEDAKQGLRLDRIEAKGNVRITTKRDTVRGNHGIYDLKGQKALLTGDVKITSGQNQLNGDRAEVDLKTGVSRLLSTQSSEETGRVRALIQPGKQPE